MMTCLGVVEQIRLNLMQRKCTICVRFPYLGVSGHWVRSVRRRLARVSSVLHQHRQVAVHHSQPHKQEHTHQRDRPGVTSTKFHSDAAGCGTIGRQQVVFG